MRYVKARVNTETELKAYRIYVSDAVKLITGNTSRPYGGEALTTRYSEIIDNTPAEERSADEIISGIRKRLQEME